MPKDKIKDDNEQSNLNQATTSSNIHHHSTSHKAFPFKKSNWHSKLRNKDKQSRTAKNIKNMVIDSVDQISLNLCIYH